MPAFLAVKHVLAGETELEAVGSISFAVEPHVLVAAGVEVQPFRLDMVVGQFEAVGVPDLADQEVYFEQRGFPAAQWVERE